MPRTLAIDFGMRRTGLALSDPTDTIANGLETVETFRLMDRLRQLMRQQPFARVVVGQPMHLDGTAALLEENIELFIRALKAQFPELGIHRLDERMTSKIARHTLLASGVGRKARQNKGTLDKISATVLLQDFLNHKAQQ